MKRKLKYKVWWRPAETDWAFRIIKQTHRGVDFSKDGRVFRFGLHDLRSEVYPAYRGTGCSRTLFVGAAETRDNDVVHVPEADVMPFIRSINEYNRTNGGYDPDGVLEEQCVFKDSESLPVEAPSVGKREKRWIEIPSAPVTDMDELEEELEDARKEPEKESKDSTPPRDGLERAEAGEECTLTERLLVLSGKRIEFNVYRRGSLRTSLVGRLRDVRSTGDTWEVLADDGRPTLFFEQEVHFVNVVKGVVTVDWD